MRCNATHARQTYHAQVLNFCFFSKQIRQFYSFVRDLKPANIFLTLDGTVKVGDLGLSRELSEHTVMAHSKVGTPLYMSPEVLRGDGYDFKSDVWSLGCLLYELAMLKSPFKAEGLNLYSLFQKISQGDYLPLPENYSEELRNLAYSMISTKSEDRPEIATVCAIAAKLRAQTAAQARTKGGEGAAPGPNTTKPGMGQSNGNGKEEQRKDPTDQRSDPADAAAAPAKGRNGDTREHVEQTEVESKARQRPSAEAGDEGVEGGPSRRGDPDLVSGGKGGGRERNSTQDTKGSAGRGGNEGEKERVWHGGCGIRVLKCPLWVISPTEWAVYAFLL